MSFDLAKQLIDGARSNGFGRPVNVQTGGDLVNAKFAGALIALREAEFSLKEASEFLGMPPEAVGSLWPEDGGMGGLPPMHQPGPATAQHDPHEMAALMPLLLQMLQAQGGGNAAGPAPALPAPPAGGPPGGGGGGGPPPGVGGPPSAAAGGPPGAGAPPSGDKKPEKKDSKGGDKKPEKKDSKGGDKKPEKKDSKGGGDCKADACKTDKCASVYARVLKGR